MVNVEGSEHPSLLDKEYTSARKRYRRMFHRVKSGLERGGELRLITLTTRCVDDNQNFQRDFRKLRMRLLRRGLLVDYIRCPELTRSGLRHEHVIFRGSFIEQQFLSKLWEDIHGAPVVYIQRVRRRHRIASYLANYLAKSPAGRYSYSWGWVWKGFVKTWEALKKYVWENGYDFKEGLYFWVRCVRMGVKGKEALLNEISI